MIESKENQPTAASNVLSDTLIPMPPPNDPKNTEVTATSTTDERKQIASYRAMRRALKRAADLAMRYDDSAAAANEALAILHAELIWRFELCRSRQRQPELIVPKLQP